MSAKAVLRAPRTRLVAVVLLLLSLALTARALGLSALTDPRSLRAAVASAGPLGPLLFCGLFVAAVLAQIPGVVFVAVAPALFSPPLAFLLCVLASNLAVILGFAMVRMLGGQSLAQLERPWMQRVLSALDRRPVRSVAILRIVTIMFPPVTTALALSSVRAADHALGSFLGMLVPITAILVTVAWFLPGW